MGLFDRLFGKREPDNVVGMGMATDPVCHMQVDTRAPPGGTSTHGATTYVFCSPGCRTRFEAEPHRYAGPHAH